MKHIKTIGDCIPKDVQQQIENNSLVMYYLNKQGFNSIQDFPYEVVDGEEQIVDLGGHKYTILPVVYIEETLKDIVTNGYKRIRNQNVRALSRIFCNRLHPITIKDADWSSICESYINHYKSILGENWSHMDFEMRVKNLKYRSHKYAIDNNTGKTIVVGFFGTNIAYGAGGEYLTNAELYVLPQFRGRGIASELVKQSFELASACGIYSFDSLTYKAGHHNPLKFWEGINAETTELIHVAGDIGEMIDAISTREESNTVDKKEIKSGER